MVSASYNLRDNAQFRSEKATLLLYDTGTSEMSLDIRYVYGGVYELPEGAYLRLTKADGVEGNYGEAPIGHPASNPNARYLYHADIPFDRSFGPTEHLTFTVYNPDGTELFPLKFALDYFVSSGNTWPEPESTPPLPTIPPAQPTPTPSPRPTLAPDATEPPQDSARFTMKYILREYTANFTERSAVLRVYDDMSALTVQFKYAKAIDEGTTMRMVMADGKYGLYGEAPLLTLEDGTKQVTFLFNHPVGTLNMFNLEAYAPGAQVRSFKAFYKLNSRASAEWSKLDPIATLPPASTPVPAPANPLAASGSTEPTTAPTAPPQKLKTSTGNFALLDPVKHFTLKRANHIRYDADLSVLQLQFLYDAELPAKAWIRITNREYTEGNFGEAQIERGEDGLLTATIVTDQLQGSLRAYRLKCIDENGKELFYADFYPRLSSYWDGGTEVTMARTFLPTATPEPTDMPAPTATVAPTADPSASATPAPTEPPYKEAYSKRKFLPTDKVKKYANYNTTLRRYEEFDVLTVTFRYSEKLPEGTTLRLVRVDTLLDDFGAALILPAELDGAGSDLLSAKIVSDRIPLNCASLRLEAVTPEGDVLFQADYYPDVKGYSADQARDFLDAPLETPAPSETPTP